MGSDIDRRFMCSKVSSIVGTFLIYLSGRPTYYWGNMSVYVLSYLYQHTSNQDSSTQPHWLLAIFIICWMTTSLSVSTLEHYISPRVLILTGILFCNCCFFLSVYIVRTSLSTFVIVYGSLFGMANGLYDGLLLKHYVTDWTTNDLARVTSIVMSAYPSGGVITNELITWYTNPKNLSPDKTILNYQLFSQKEILQKVPSMFLVLGLASSVIQIIGFCLLRQKDQVEDSKLDKSFSTPPSNSDGLSCCGDDKNTNNQNYKTCTSINEGDENKEEEENYTLFQMLVCGRFYLLWIGFLLMSVSRFLTNVYYKLFADVWIKDDKFLTDVGTVAFLLTTGFSLLWGAILDRLGLKKCLILMFSTSAILLFLMYFSAIWNKWAYAIITLVCMNFADASYMCFSVALIKWFGKRYISRNFALLLTALIALFYTGPSTVDVLVSRFGWFYPFLWASSMTTLGLILVTLFYPDS